MDHIYIVQKIVDCDGQTEEICVHATKEGAERCVERQTQELESERERRNFKFGFGGTLGYEFEISSHDLGE
jgi:hypothetical protein